MRGGPRGERVAEAVRWERVPRNAVALDVVYAPPNTPFLDAARARSVRLALAAGWWGLREVLQRPVVDTLRRAAE